jgi:hypothetical protein
MTCKTSTRMMHTAMKKLNFINDLIIPERCKNQKKPWFALLLSDTTLQEKYSDPQRSLFLRMLVPTGLSKLSYPPMRT